MQLVKLAKYQTYDEVSFRVLEDYVNAHNKLGKSEIAEKKAPGAAKHKFVDIVRKKVIHKHK